MRYFNHLVHSGCYAAIVAGEVLHAAPYKLGGYGILAFLPILAVSHALSHKVIGKNDEEDAE